MSHHITYWTSEQVFKLWDIYEENDNVYRKIIRSVKDKDELKEFVDMYKEEQSEICNDIIMTVFTGIKAFLEENITISEEDKQELEEHLEIAHKRLKNVEDNILFDRFQFIF